MTPDRIAIACSIDDRYALPLVVMLESLVERLRAPWRATVHLLHRGLSRQSLAAVASVVDLRPIELSGPCLDRLPRDGRLPLEAAAPLLLPELIPPDVPRVLFLDADMLVLDDIGPLWTLDLAGRALAAAVDPAIPLCHSPRGVPRAAARGIPPHTPYFNAGVMLVDLDAWRSRGIADRAFRYVGELGSRVDFLHQQALNATAWDDWTRLDQRWNVPATAGRWFDATPAAAVAAPGIVHFAGRMKPWRMRVTGRFAEPYARALSRVAGRLPAQPRTVQDTLAGFYDRRLRCVCHPCERFLWTRGLL
jgi:lipopolysaccharide biosynthesis glycosyltransferase